MGFSPERLVRTALCVLVCSACYSQGLSTATPVRDQTRAAPGVATVDTSAWRGTHPAGVAALLEGRFAGVDVRSVPGGGVSVRIRGASSLMLGTEPLYVVDGMPRMVGPNGALDELSPDDIARIQVLKGPAATALWGGRGANGVILITTKER